MNHLERVREKIENRTLEIAVVGLGYVGLPLAERFAAGGFRVTGIDLDAAKVDALNAGSSYIPDVPSAAIVPLVEKGLLRATTDPAAIAAVDFVSVCVPTPLSKFREPNLSAVLAVTEELKRRLKPGHVIVLESTTYPGTTEEMVLPQLQSTGLEAGKDYFLAFSPERIDPGRTDFTLKNTPKVVGGLTPDCTEAAAAVYGAVVDRVLKVKNPRTAEMTKMLENTFRSVNIALVNEMAIICDRLAIDAFEVIAAAATKPFGFMPFLPGPGLGGHCIPVDPLYLSWKMRSLDYKARFIDMAEEVNRAMPGHVVGKVFAALNARGKAVKGSRVLVMGAAYKRDIDDVRESPALDVIRLLKQQGARVSYHDPWVPRLDVETETLESVPFDGDVLRQADCAVIVTDHSSIDYEKLVRSVPVVVDARNATARFRHLGAVVSL